MKVIFFGFFLHIVFLLSVFDIYFKSPIINNIPVQEENIEAPAKRLVLFVADGLRADSIFTVSNNEFLSPHIRKVMESRGVWGVAHSRVPTESRPGHIALIAGFYEDPSAVFTGWKDNLVEFDSLFNRSHVTYSWGSPDILPMFKKGAAGNKVHTDCYQAENEDFSGHGSTRLNTWVFDRVEQFLVAAKSSVRLSNLLNSDGVVFFLHLLGPDVAGHASKPHSRQYKENINVVDEGVRRVERLVDEFYNRDNKTAFIYTSDHGMTDWGSHGAGSASETEVPLVVWGAGVSSPRPPDHWALFSPPQWQLSHLRRVDVAQADICPLMAALIGVPIPVHSVGVLPLEYLSAPVKEKAAMLLRNANQLTSQFGRKRETVEANLLPWLYFPFPSLTRDREQWIRDNISVLIKGEKYEEAMDETKVLIQLSQSGLEYYHSYFQGLLLACVSLSFLGWMCWLLCQLLSHSPSDSRTRPHKRPHLKSNNQAVRKVKFWPDVVFLCSAATVVLLIYMQSLPLQFHLYCCLPLHLWWNVLRQVQVLRSNVTKFQPLRVVGSVILALILLELLVMTFYERWVLSLVVAAVGLWPFTLGERRRLVPLSVQMLWFIVFVLLAVFPALPVIGHQKQVEFVVLCGGLWLLLGLVSLYTLGMFKARWTLPTQLVMLSVASALVLSTAKDFERGTGLQLINQLVAWVLLVISPAVPLWTDKAIPVRLLSLGLGFSVPFLLLCVGHEAFFLIALFLALCVWVATESFLARTQLSSTKFKESSATTKNVSVDDFRKSFFFLMFIILSFFGTGNIASINSFDVSWVRCFLTVFSPFVMMVLILLKTIIPFFLVTCCFHAINILSQVKAEQMFIIVLVYCDVMGLHFLFSVTTRGSWLEIGTSVSHFVIMEVTVLFLAALYGLARFMTGTMLARRDNTTNSSGLPLHKKHPE